MTCFLPIKKNVKNDGTRVEAVASMTGWQNARRGMLTGREPWMLSAPCYLPVHTTEILDMLV